ncbi:Ger(x)C family spore germination protein [Paenibacillus koleovorans]|uniref:Ger(x)C family spore germination protein n=1 Tax=Paenibacillus koleovorans TaxID=121608 RepID=UPI000FD9E728|nr:Ger(x)C family spore germination protein [Paenibacillus koleovorans]
MKLLYRRMLAAGLPLVLLGIVLTGCWDAKSIDKRLLPLIMGIDQSDDRQYYTVRLLVPRPEGGCYSIQGKAATISDAIDQMKMNQERGIGIVHVDTILIGQSLAREGIHDVMEYAFRSRELKSKAKLAVVKGNAGTLITQLEEDKGKSTRIQDFFDTHSGWDPSVALTYVWEAFRDVFSETTDMALPYLEKGTDSEFQVAGSVIMRDDRMMGVISADDTLLYNAFRDRGMSGIIEVTPSASMQILSTSLDYSKEWNAGVPVLHTTLKMDCFISEKKLSGAKASIPMLKEELETLLNDRYRKLFQRLQRERCDVLSTGLMFRSKLAPDQIDRWEEEYYPKLEFDFRTVVNISNTGELKLFN